VKIFSLEGGCQQIPLHPSNRSNPQPGVPPGNDFPERYAYFADTLQKASQLICFGIRNAISMASLTPERNPSGEALTFCSMNTFVNRTPYTSKRSLFNT
jgi:hypothetical protein